MTVFDDIVGSMDRIEYILKKRPTSRDQDSDLIAAYWYYETGKGINDMTALQFLEFISKGLLTPPATIIRARRKVQEQNPALRGERYAERQSQEKIVRNNISKI